MNKIVDVVKLMARTGLFFASCDGNYDQRERQFIEGYIAGIEQIGDLDKELKGSVRHSLDETPTLDQIIADTRALLDGFNDDERKVIVMTIDVFIDKVIRLDGKTDSSEAANYAEWRKEMGV